MPGHARPVALPPSDWPAGPRPWTRWPEDRGRPATPGTPAPGPGEHRGRGTAASQPVPEHAMGGTCRPAPPGPAPVLPRRVQQHRTKQRLLHPDAVVTHHGYAPDRAWTRPATEPGRPRSRDGTAASQCLSYGRSPAIAGKQSVDVASAPGGT